MDGKNGSSYSHCLLVLYSLLFFFLLLFSALTALNNYTLACKQRCMARDNKYVSVTRRFE